MTSMNYKDKFSNKNNIIFIEKIFHLHRFNLCDRQKIERILYFCSSFNFLTDMGSDIDQKHQQQQHT